jgi:formylmethanofuran dehydrogenase subunit E
MSDYKPCDRCREKVLAGDIRYAEQTGEELCEYCYDSYLEEYPEED